VETQNLASLHISASIKTLLEAKSCALTWWASTHRYCSVAPSCVLTQFLLDFSILSILLYPFKLHMRKIEIRKESLTIAVTLTALSIVFSQLFYFQAFANNAEEIKIEQHDSQQEESQTYISLPSTSLPSSTHVELNQSMVFLFEIIFERKEPDERNFSVLLPQNRFFKTLFDSVISPNAP
jgi:hypothetical protein